MPKDNEVDEKVMPDNAARATPVAWLVTNGGQSCEPWLVYERSEVEAHPADCIADPLYSAATVTALEAEVERLRSGIDVLAKQWRDEAEKLRKSAGRALKVESAGYHPAVPHSELSSAAHDADGYATQLEALTGAGAK